MNGARKIGWCIAPMLIAGAMVLLTDLPAHAQVPRRPLRKPAPKVVVPSAKVVPKPAAKPVPIPGVKPVRPPVRPVIPPYVRRPLLGVTGVLLFRDSMSMADSVSVADSAPTVDSASAAAATPAAVSLSGSAYRVLAVSDDYVVTLLMDDRQTPVRLLGVEPPLQESTGGSSAVLPKAAKRFVEKLLIGQSVWVVQDSTVAEKDASGVLVAYLYRSPDQLPLNQEIVSQGYGIVSDGYAFERQSEFRQQQKKAREQGKGVWSAKG